MRIMDKELNKIELAKRVSIALVVAVGAIGITGCGSSSAESPSSTPITSVINPETDHMNLPGLKDPAKRLNAESIISTFENSTTEIRYSYAERLEDGRGITAGRSGFTSGTNDLLEVVGLYRDKVVQSGGDEHANQLVQYLPALQAIQDEKAKNGDPYGMSASTEGLDGFEGVWQSTSENDPLLNEAQDDVYTELYFNPAMEAANEAGVTTPLGQLIILDTIIQHGGGDGPDGLASLIAETQSKIGPLQENEEQWLRAFLKVRTKHLNNPADSSTREAWRESVDRVRALRTILLSGNTQLERPINWSVYGDPFTLEP